MPPYLILIADSEKRTRGGIVLWPRAGTGRYCCVRTITKMMGFARQRLYEVGCGGTQAAAGVAAGSVLHEGAILFACYATYLSDRFFESITLYWTCQL